MSAVLSYPIGNAKREKVCLFVYLTTDLTIDPSLKIVGPENLRSAFRESLEKIIEDILLYRGELENKRYQT